jgi:hypothetical protein
MPVNSRIVTANTTRVQISNQYDYNQFIYLQSGTPLATIWIGGPDVTNSNGIVLTQASGTLEFRLGVDDVIYVVADRSAIVRVLEIQ